MIAAPQSIKKQGNYKSEIKIHKEQLENWIKIKEQTLGRNQNHGWEEKKHQKSSL